MKYFFAVFALLLASSAWATNGMNLGGYGPIAGGMGGASMAYDNGLSAMMNNPATLGLMSQGGRFEVGAALMNPIMSAEFPGQNKADSSAKSFFMPGIGGTQHNGTFTYGVGFFSQGGMGATYASDSFLAEGTNDIVQSQLGVFRAMLPIAYNMTPELSLGATVDYVRAGLNLKMAINPYQFTDLYMPGLQQSGTTSGTLVTSMATGLPGTLNWARFDFSNSSSFMQEAAGGGLSAKIGAIYQITSQLSVGGAYHLKTSFSDLTTANGTVSANKSGTTYCIPGQVKVQEFAWPATFGVGAAFRPINKLLLVADYRYIGWSSVMKNFKMNFTTSGNITNGVTIPAGQTMDTVLYQNWNDQNIIQIGGAYQVLEDLTVRGGINIANNPIPERYTNPLFAAIIKEEYNLGVGYAVSKTSNMDFSFGYTPEVSINTPRLTSLSPVTYVNMNTKLSGYGLQFGYGMSF